MSSLFLLIGCLIFSAFFSGAETAYTSLTPVQIEALGASGYRGLLTAKLMKRPRRLLTTVLIGNNLMNIGAGVIATQITIRMWGNAVVGVTAGLLTLIILIVSEIIPKQIAIVHNEFICVHTVYLVYLFSFLFLPVGIVLNVLSDTAIRFVKDVPSRQLTLAGVLQVVRSAENLGLIEQYKSHIMKNLIRINEIPVRAVMTHRTAVVGIERNAAQG